MLAEDFVVVDVNSPSWSAVRPYVEAALQLEQNEGSFAWHGWDKHYIGAFLQHLPSPCALMVAVWEDTNEVGGVSNQQTTQEALVLGCVCEVIAGEVHSVRTFASLRDNNLPPLEALEPGYQHAFELLRVAGKLVAPVAWALFTDKRTWHEWIFTENNHGRSVDKGELLTELTQQGRCVLMGTQTTHHHP